MNGLTAQNMTTSAAPGRPKRSRRPVEIRDSCARLVCFPSPASNDLRFDDAGRMMRYDKTVEKRGTGAAGKVKYVVLRSAHQPFLSLYSPLLLPPESILRQLR